MVKRRGGRSDDVETKDAGFLVPDPDPETEPQVEDPKPSEPEPKPEAKAEPEERPKPTVPLRVFRGLSGMRADQFAGFERYVAQQKMGPATVVEWRERLDAFQNKPVRPARKR